MVTIRADETSKIIRKLIEQYNTEVQILNTGTVLQVVFIQPEDKKLHNLYIEINRKKFTYSDWLTLANLKY